MKLSSCSEHKESESEFLFLHQQKLKLMCSQCLYIQKTQQDKIDVSKIVHLKQLNQAEFLQKILPKCLKHTLNYQDQVIALKSCLQNRLSEIEKMLAELFKLQSDTKDKIQDLEDIFIEINSGINQTLDFDSLFQCFTQTCDILQYNPVQQIENSLFECVLKYRESYCKHYEQFKCSLEKSVNQYLQSYTNSYVNLMKLSKSGKEDIEQNFGQIEKSLNRWQSSKLIDFHYLSQLVCIIERKLQREIHQVIKLHLGTEHGFNIAVLLNKLDRKKHMLIIFKSRLGSIFGAFTPCDWQTDNWNLQFAHTKDKEQHSFLFSYNKKEIYSIKKDESLYACYISKKYGIMFGGSFYDNKYKYEDLFIKEDFKGGHSNLGFAYSAEIKEEEKSTYLFGEEEPNIVEFEVYELI